MECDPIKPSDCIDDCFCILMVAPTRLRLNALKPHRYDEEWVVDASLNAGLHGGPDLASAVPIIVEATIPCCGTDDALGLLPLDEAGTDGLTGDI